MKKSETENKSILTVEEVRERHEPCHKEIRRLREKISKYEQFLDTIANGYSKPRELAAAARGMK